MKISVTGAKGYIGSRLTKLGCSSLSSDVTDAVELDDEIYSERPDLVIHLAGISDVNAVEDMNNLELSDEVNINGSKNVFELCRKHNVPVIYISSDHVFSGKWWGSYTEESEDLLPVNYYGIQKFVVEATSREYQNVYIVRTSMLFDKERPSIKHYLDIIKEGRPVYPPFFMWRSFMHVDNFAVVLHYYATKVYAANSILKSEPMPKVLNISGSKNASWWRFIKTYAEYQGLNHELVIPRYRQINLPGEAPRPMRCGLSNLKAEALGLPQFSYMDGIAL